MKTIKYIASFALLGSLCFGTSGCSEQESLPTGNDERGTEITGFTLGMTGRTSETGTTTKAPATQAGFSVNTATDPTFKGLADRVGSGPSDGWKMDFTLYYKDGSDNNTEKKYDDGSFTGASYTVNDKGIATLTPSSQRYYPNYLKPQAEAYLYPTAYNSEVDKEQNTADNLFAQDILIREKAALEVSHNPKITFKHKHSMLDFVIKDVMASDIEKVTVKVGNDSYTPYQVTTTTTYADGSSDLEYMVILPEITQGKANNPIVVIETTSGTTSSIIYKQEIKILTTDDATLGSNKCYCFSLQGVKLQISPVTVINWATGASIPGEYIAVTAYPTFKAPGYAEQTFYFYYDNKLTENDADGAKKAKLQEITFNKNAECTIKPDGRILTHIYKEDEVENINEGSESMTPKENVSGTSVNIILGQMIIDLTGEMPTTTTP